MGLIPTLLDMYSRNQRMKTARKEYNRDLAERAQDRAERKRQQEQQQIDRSYEATSQWQNAALNELNQEYDALGGKTSFGKPSIFGGR